MVTRWGPTRALITGLLLASLPIRLQADPATGGKPGSCSTPCTPPAATPDEQRLIGKIMEAVKVEGSIANAMEGRTPEQFIAHLGFDATRFDLGRVRNLVEAELKATGCESASRCTTYGACSLVGDLATAKGEELARFRQEKQEDGRAFSDTTAPAFELESLTGKKVSLSGLRGRRVALVLWGTHCSHSLESLGAYDQLRKEVAPTGLEVLSVMVGNNPTPELRAWIPSLSKDLPVLVADGTQVAGYNTALVPSLYLIDEVGKLQQKFVGQKTPVELKHIFTRFALDGKPVPTNPSTLTGD